jgi:hypothetical protein
MGHAKTIQVILFFLLVGSCNCLFGQIISKDTLLSQNNLPPKWKDSLVKRNKWVLVEHVQIRNKRLFHVDKVGGDNIRFLDTSIQMFDAKSGTVFFPYVKYFQQQNAFAASTKPIDPNNLRPDPQGYKVIYLRDSILVLEYIDVGYFDFATGKIFSAVELEEKAKQQDRARSIWTADNGVKATWTEWENLQREFQVYKAN